VPRIHSVDARTALGTHRLRLVACRPLANLYFGRELHGGEGGLLALSRSIAGEFGSDGITANCVAPGYIDTAMAALHGGERMPRSRRISARTRGHPQEVAAAIAFLASEEAAT